MRTKSGDYVQTRHVGAVLRNDGGRPSLIGGIIINEGVMENVDSVTILPNHYAFFNNLPELMRAGGKNVILLVGINKMDQINESLGYSHGNRVLQQVSWVIQEEVGGKGDVYRKEGAKFAVVSKELSEHEMTVVYRRIRQKLLTQIRVDDTRHTLTINGGLISFEGFGMDPRTLQSCLSYAYNESKTRKRGSLVNFDGNAKRGDRTALKMLDDIRRDLINEKRGFFVEFQPLLLSGKDSVSGFEALVRWKSDEWGVVHPDDFIHVLEDDIAFGELGDWIFENALAQGKRLLEIDPEIKIGINISPIQVRDEFFVDGLKQILRRTDFPAENLCLEFTRDCRLLDSSILCDTALALHSNGINISLDDYGTGYDSLDFLKILSADFVKFDRKFTQNLSESGEDRLALKHLTALASVYDTNVCIKGIEDAETEEIVREYPIRSVQGDFFSKPLPIDDAVEFLRGRI